jgi:hypothetical protein
MADTDKIIICSRITTGTSNNDTCPFHPAAAPTDGRETELRDMLMQPGCPGRTKT